MADACTITLTDAPDPADAQFVRAGLDAYNVMHTGPINWRPLAIFVRDAGGAIAGGLLGCTYWGWLTVDILWIADALRGQGYGSRLLAMAEDEALRRGCRHAHLDTMDFQALPFYLARGYRLWGELQDLPAGHTRHFLQKELAPGSPG